MIKRRPQRLDVIYSSEPVYFVTFCTRDRQPIPDLGKAQTALEAYAQRGIKEFGAALGRYVIMPDHIHLFVSGDADFVLSKWVAGLKRVNLKSRRQSRRILAANILRSHSPERRKLFRKMGIRLSESRKSRLGQEIRQLEISR